MSVLPMGEYGLTSATRVAEEIVHSFPNSCFGLMVGIGGGAPSPKHDIRLGDIVVSMPTNGQGGVLQYDFGKTIQDQSFHLTRFLDKPPTLLCAAANGLKAQYESEGHMLDDAVSKILEKRRRLRKNYERPDPASDVLYQSHIVHAGRDEEPCITRCGNDPSCLVSRVLRGDEDDNPTVHYGLIASANQLMKDALIRDRLSAEKNVLCFEMKAAGLVNDFPCLVFRGICDYADSHKNSKWQGYAAIVAAAYPKDLLYRVVPQQVKQDTKRNLVHQVVPQQIQQDAQRILLYRTACHLLERYNIYLYICYQCGDGPKSVNIQPKCIGCDHGACKHCEQVPFER